MEPSFTSGICDYAVEHVKLLSFCAVLFSRTLAVFHYRKNNSSNDEKNSFTDERTQKAKRKEMVEKRIKMLDLSSEEAALACLGG